MSSVYIHIPFCKSRCHYCDFYSVTNLKHKNDYLGALTSEIFLTRDYLHNSCLQTIYIGGGTPSLLTVADLNSIFETLKKYYLISYDSEITIEVNPDDISFNYLRELLSIGINRLSIGIQTFQTKLLHLLGRRHTSGQAFRSINTAYNAGFNNISIDLMYGLPGQTIADFLTDLEAISNLPVSHFSAYHLGIEPGTVFHQWLKRGFISSFSDSESFLFYKYLLYYVYNNNFTHYEISNYSLPGYYSRHNLVYWSLGEYLGLGPAAHSFNGIHRSWNIADISDYLFRLSKGILPFESERLTTTDLFNDYLITALRTNTGISYHFIYEYFGAYLYNSFIKNVQNLSFSEGNIHFTTDGLRLTDKGLWFSDTIISELIIL